MSESPEACPGSYRTDSAFIFFNPDQVLASASEVETLVENVFRYMNESSDHDVEVMINVHSWLVRIHPFADGNGRIVRLVLAFLAFSARYSGIAFTQGAARYFRAIHEWDDDPSVFGSIVVEELRNMFKLYEKAYSEGEMLAKRRGNSEFMFIN